MTYEPRLPSLDAHVRVTTGDHAGREGIVRTLRSQSAGIVFDGEANPTQVPFEAGFEDAETSPLRRDLIALFEEWDESSAGIILGFDELADKVIEVVEAAALRTHAISSRRPARPLT